MGRTLLNWHNCWTRSLQDVDTRRKSSSSKLERTPFEDISHVNMSNSILSFLVFNKSLGHIKHWLTNALMFLIDYVLDVNKIHVMFSLCVNKTYVLCMLEWQNIWLSASCLLLCFILFDLQFLLLSLNLQHMRLFTQFTPLHHYWI